MQKIAKFSKVSFEQFKKDWRKSEINHRFNEEKGIIEETPDEKLREIYDSIELPTRATSGSAGYDFHIPDDLIMHNGYIVTIPTGVRCEIEEGWVLNVYPRSGHGFKFGLHLANTVGIIDQDYFYAENEGHIQVKIVMDGIMGEQTENANKCLSLKRGDAFCQGVFLPYGITKDDEADGIRTGGMGSTDKK